MAHDSETINGVEVRVGYLPVPHAFVNSESGTAIVLGRAPGWLDELDIAMEATGYDAPIFAINGQEKLKHYKGISGLVDLWVTIHGALFPEYESGTGPTRHTVKPILTTPNADIHWPLVGTADGSSALTAVLIARMMGYEKTVVAGVHLITRTEVLPDGRKIMDGYAFFRTGWVKRFDTLKDHVRCVSPEGNFLRDLYGGPDDGLQ